MDLNFSQPLVVQFWLLKKGKSSEFDFQDTGESPRDPLSQPGRGEPEHDFGETTSFRYKNRCS